MTNSWPPPKSMRAARAASCPGWNVSSTEGTSLLNPQVQREGVVLRPFVEEHDEDIGGRLSFKVINPKFLLRYDE